MYDTLKDKMTVSEITALLPGTVRIFKEGSPLIYQGEIPRSGYFIKRGVIKAYTLQRNGEERLTAFFAQGDFLPLSWLFRKSNISMYYYETTELCELIAVTRQDIDEIVVKNTDLQSYLLHKLVNDNAAYLVRVTALEQARAVEKLLYTLYYLLYQFGTTKDGELYTINIKLTHSVIASLVGLTRETTATELKKLKQKKIISYSKKQYSLRKSLLEQAMGEDSFSALIK